MTKPPDTAHVPHPPPGAELIVYDDHYRFGKERKGKPYMWTWIGADRWYMADQFSIDEKADAKDKEKA
jgi:hypothetical protein